MSIILLTILLTIYRKIGLPDNYSKWQNERNILYQKKLYSRITDDE